MQERGAEGRRWAWGKGRFACLLVALTLTLALALTLACGGGGGGGGGSVPPAQPPALPSVIAFSAATPDIFQGQSAQLTWSVSGATSLSVDQGVGPVSGQGITVSPDVTTTYTLTAINGAGSVPAKATVTVTPPPSITAFDATPSAIFQGQSTQLTWSVSGATSLSVDQGVGPVSGSGVTVNPSVTTTYTLTATNGAGSVPAKATVTVTPPPSIAAFDAAPSAIFQGQSTLLTWSVSGATSLSVDQGVGPVSGSGVTVSPGVTTTYTLTATNGAGSVPAKATVTVTPPPSITAFDAVPSAIFQGQSTQLTWSVSGATSLSVDQGVGPVSGSGVTVSPSVTTTYTLTATNGAGSVPAKTTVTVAVAPPSGLTYALPQGVYTKGTAIPLNHPTSTGGPVASYQVAPALPAGLSLNSATGDITGLPTALASRADYTVTATNASGSTPATLTITVQDVAPSIGYGNGAFTFTLGTAIAPLVPQNSGGPVVSWAISPPPPAGLVFSTTDGSIRGTPTVLAPAAGYEVTATNTGGSCAVTPSLAVLPPAPTVTVAPTSCTVDLGAAAGFTVTADGTGTLSYQWLKDGAPITGATGLTYTTPPTTMGDQGALFQVTITDAYGGQVTSDAAALTVLPDLATWLGAHPNVAAAIRWQFQPANLANSYQAPADTDKVAWAGWSASQKDDLNQAYLAAKAWFGQGAHQVAMDQAGLTDQPANQHPQISNDSLSPMEWVTPAYMWKLYVAHVAFALAQEIAHPLPWSLADDSDETLRYLLDSSVMAWNLPNGNFGMGTYAGANFPPLRANTRPQTTFAPPMWTYPWLAQAGLIGATRQETIGKVLEWMRGNMWHFYGSDSFGTYNAVWQYRGYVPLSKVVAGTVDANNPGQGTQHWTAGCHGSVGFLHAVLRVLNIPVQPVWVCGHELAYFTSEKRYLDHGDDPYNAVVRAAPGSSILNLLIDEATYRSWFTNDLTVNITDFASPAGANVGRKAREFQ